MKLYEYEGKQLFHRMGIATPVGRVIDDPGAAAAAGEEIGYPVVLKAQVQQGGRGKLGAVAFADDSAAAETIARRLLSLTIHKERVGTLLVEQKLTVADEIYLGITFNQVRGLPVLLISTQGGINIETNVVDAAGSLMQMPLEDPFNPPPLYRILEQCLQIGINGRLLNRVAAIALKLIKGYFRYDAITAEINPLVIDKAGAVFAADAKFELDSSAAFRFPKGIPRKRETDGQDLLESEAAGKGLAYIRLSGGNIGVIAGGAGLSMATMDMVAAFGGQPANFLDLGGGASSQKSAESLRMVLKTPGIRGVVINVFGGINNCEIMANGIAEVIRNDRPGIPIVVKMRGYSQEEGWRILEALDVPLVKHGTTEEAVKLLMRKVTRGEEKCRS